MSDELSAAEILREVLAAADGQKVNQHQDVPALNSSELLRTAAGTDLPTNTRALMSHLFRLSFTDGDDPVTGRMDSSG